MSLDENGVIKNHKKEIGEHIKNKRKEKEAMKKKKKTKK